MDSESGLRSPDPPLQTQEQAGSASLTVTLVPIELIFSFATPPPPTRHVMGVLLDTLSRYCMTERGGGGWGAPVHIAIVKCRLDVNLAAKFCNTARDDGALQHSAA